MSDGGHLVLDRVSIERGGRPVVRDVSLEVEAGAVTALLGPNGAGKSSLVLAVGGLLRVKSGAISQGEAILTGWRPERIRSSGVAIVPEGRRLLPALTTHDNLRVATYALAPAAAKAGIAYALALFPELQPLLGQVARTLSGGQQQMVVLAQALVSRPRFLLIDELSLGLAPVVVKRLVATVRDVAADGVGILLVEQFTSVALGLARRAYILEGGEVRFDGTAEALRADPDLLQSVYLLRGRELTGVSRQAGS